MKEKKIEKEIYIDLAVVVSQWSEVAVYDNSLASPLAIVFFVVGTKYTIFVN